MTKVLQFPKNPGKPNTVPDRSYEEVVTDHYRQLVDCLYQLQAQLASVEGAVEQAVMGGRLEASIQKSDAQS